jgi:nicotinamide mononucleotide (NMN) deamidase PncC
MPFVRAVSRLKSASKTVTIVESCCGGAISAGVMKVPGASSVYYGGTVAYNTKMARPLLLNDAELHSSLVNNGVVSMEGESDEDRYIR